MGSMIKHRLVSPVTAVTLLLIVLVGASPARAAEHHLRGAFAAFDDCPLILAQLNTCLLAEIGSGVFAIGTKTVPINAKLILQGGLLQEVENGPVTFIAAENGDTLSKTALSVPGGLTGILAAGYLPSTLREAFNRDVNLGLTDVTVTAELARPAAAIAVDVGKLFSRTGVALQLPVKVKLSNPFLGASCYIGSYSNPIFLNLTTGATSPPLPNGPINGATGPFVLLEEGLIVVLPRAALVDNAFTVPVASGCGGSLSAVIDPAVDAQLGLPSRAGHNTAILDSKIDLSTAEDVREHE